MTLATNANLLGADQVVVVMCNIAGATFAAVAFWVASVKVARYRCLNIASALLATTYVACYLVLLLTNVEQATWSTTVRWFGIVAWPLVWATPPLRLIRRTPIYEALAARAALRGDD